jgi:hypothetical protein
VHLLRGGCHRPEIAGGVSNHQPRRVDVQQLDAALRQGMEEIHGIEVADQRVGELHKGISQRCLASHFNTSIRRAATSRAIS